MMVFIETLALILLIIMVLAVPIGLVCYVVNLVLYYRRTSANQYYILNNTGGIFKGYTDEVQRDIDLEGYRNMGYNFTAHNKWPKE